MLRFNTRSKSQSARSLDLYKESLTAALMMDADEVSDEEDDNENDTRDDESTKHDKAEVVYDRKNMRFSMKKGKETNAEQLIAKSSTESLPSDERFYLRLRRCVIHPSRADSIPKLRKLSSERFCAIQKIVRISREAAERVEAADTPSHSVLIAELSRLKDLISSDKHPWIQPDTMEDPINYSKWKDGQLELLSRLIAECEQRKGKGALHLQVASATNSKAIDRHGGITPRGSDLFVKIGLLNSKQKWCTSVKKKQASATWNEAFDIEIQNATDVIKVSLNNKNEVMSSSKIGSGLIPLSVLNNKGMIAIDLDLMDPGDKNVYDPSHPRVAVDKEAVDRPRTTSLTKMARRLSIDRERIPVQTGVVRLSACLYLPNEGSKDNSGFYCNEAVVKELKLLLDRIIEQGTEGGASDSCDAYDVSSDWLCLLEEYAIRHGCSLQSIRVIQFECVSFRFLQKAMLFSGLNRAETKTDELDERKLFSVRPVPFEAFLALQTHFPDLWSPSFVLTKNESTLRARLIFQLRETICMMISNYSEIFLQDKETASKSLQLALQVLCQLNQSSNISTFVKEFIKEGIFLKMKVIRRKDGGLVHYMNYLPRLLKWGRVEIELAYKVFAESFATYLGYVLFSFLFSFLSSFFFYFPFFFYRPLQMSIPCPHETTTLFSSRFHSLFQLLLLVCKALILLCSENGLTEIVVVTIHKEVERVAQRAAERQPDLVYEALSANLLLMEYEKVVSQSGVNVSRSVDLASVFNEHKTKWVQTICAEMGDVIDRCIEKDDFTPLPGFHHSTSPVDFFQIYQQFAEFLVRQKPERKTVIMFAEGISDGTLIYIKLLSALIEDRLPTSPETKSPVDKLSLTTTSSFIMDDASACESAFLIADSDGKVKPLSVSLAFCTVINNAQKAIRHLNDILTVLRDCLDDPLSKEKIEIEIQEISDNFEERSQEEFDGILDGCLRQMHSIFCYEMMHFFKHPLSSQQNAQDRLSHFYNTMTPILGSFQERIEDFVSTLLGRFWTELMKVLCSMCHDDGGEYFSVRVQGEADLLLAGIDKMQEFFAGDGSGLPEAYMKKRSEKIRQLLGLFSLSSQVLESEYENGDEQIKGTILRIFSNRPKCPIAYGFMKRIENMDVLTPEIRTDFDLDPQAICLDRFKCVYRKIHHGTLYVTTVCIFFLPSWKKRQNRFKVSVGDIGIVQKVSALDLIPNSLRIRTTQEETINLHGFSSQHVRDKAISAIQRAIQSSKDQTASQSGALQDLSRTIVQYDANETNVLDGNSAKTRDMLGVSHYERLLQECPCYVLKGRKFAEATAFVFEGLFCITYKNILSKSAGTVIRLVREKIKSIVRSKLRVSLFGRQAECVDIIREDEKITIQYVPDKDLYVPLLQFWIPNHPDPEATYLCEKDRKKAERYNLSAIGHGATKVIADSSCTHNGVSGDLLVLQEEILFFNSRNRVYIPIKTMHTMRERPGIMNNKIEILDANKKYVSFNDVWALKSISCAIRRRMKLLQVKQLLNFQSKSLVSISFACSSFLCYCDHISTFCLYFCNCDLTIIFCSYLRIVPTGWRS
eukprot:TRINITY_DN2377_c0_g2_i16.p1 TRINITY_DN2377_c0_g2~~TRINITY_DN2377_c0_g2_i16.p1  ORF type:complete len:1560 (-),score=293.32 TRINITY_DN2377_c0_g2_i16:2405-7084(-)